MQKNTVLTKSLVLVGLVLLWLPVIAPFVLATIAGIARGRFLFDYMMPAELFLSVLGGAVLLFAAAVRVRERRRLIGLTTGIAILLLFASQLTAVATGLASGERAAEGPLFMLVLGMLIGYDLLLLVIGVGGILLFRDLIRDSVSGPSAASASSAASGEDKPLKGGADGP